MEINIIHAAIFVVFVQLVGVVLEMRRPKCVWVVEDSESDIVLYKVNLEVPGCHIRYFRDVNNIGWRALFNRPDGMIIDYYLRGKTRGDELLNFCKRNEIPALLVTGYEGEILGADDRDVVKKSCDHSHYFVIKNWIINRIMV